MLSATFTESTSHGRIGECCNMSGRRVCAVEQKRGKPRDQSTNARSPAEDESQIDWVDDGIGATILTERSYSSVLGNHDPLQWGDRDGPNACIYCSALIVACP